MNADSTDKCNRWVGAKEYPVGHFESQTFPQAVVEFVHDPVNLHMGDGREVMFLREVLANGPLVFSFNPLFQKA
jgi:hypothetical protein